MRVRVRQGRWLGRLALSAVIAAGVLSGSLLFDQRVDAVPARWSVVSSPNPNSGNSLDSVSCVGTAFCMAVGNGSADHGVIEEDDASGWTAIADPEIGIDTLFGVSCVSNTFCDAVGSIPDNNEEPIIETWNGTTMTVVPSPTVAVGQSSALTGLFCTSTSFCVAVGYTEFTSGPALIETWNGVAWSITSAPHSDAGNADSLSGVSCRSDVACTAVGSTFTGSHEVPLAESWNGVTWSVETTPSPGPNAELLGVSCSSSSSCIAVGEVLAADEPDQGPNQILAQSWNGATWVDSTVTNPSTNDGLLGVSCDGSKDCVAVGYDTSSAESQVLINAWNGTAWTESSSASLQSTSSALSAVTCTDSTDCVAVGVQGSSLNGQTLVEVGSSSNATSTTSTTASTTTTAPTTSTTVVGSGGGATSTTSTPVTGATTSSPGADSGTGNSSLAVTGVGIAARWLLLTGLLFLLIGIVGRRRATSRLRACDTEQETTESA